MTTTAKLSLADEIADILTNTSKENQSANFAEACAIRRADLQALKMKQAIIDRKLLKVAPPKVPSYSRRSAGKQLDALIKTRQAARQRWEYSSAKQEWLQLNHYLNQLSAQMVQIEKEIGTLEIFATFSLKGATE